MKERSILFSGPMVRALLDGSKTQTRRVVKAKPSDECPAEMWPHALKDIVEWRQQEGRWFGLMGWRSLAYADCPYGQPGDRLWVRESGVISKLRGTLEMPGLFRHDVPTTPTIGHYWVEETQSFGASYNVTGCSRAASLADKTSKVCPSIHMPRWASRITLELTGVRVERLQSISYEDAIAEGVSDFAATFPDDEKSAIGETPEQTARRLQWPQRQYQLLWDDLNAARGLGWDTNPWVWVIEFRRV